MAAEQLVVFVGSYAEAEHDGIYVYTFDENTGGLAKTDAVSGVKNPTFLNIDRQNLRLYAIGETESADKGRGAEVLAYQIDAANSGRLSLINRSTSVSAPTCHIMKDERFPILVVSSYHGGMLGSVSLEEDGRIGRLLDAVQHTGSSVHPNQDKPHLHSAYFSPDGRFIIAQDLGIDRIRTYAIDTASGKLSLQSEAATAPGAGPRHLAFHPHGEHAFVINELNSTITSFAYNSSSGQLTEHETVPTLPSDFPVAENGCAEIAISADGRYIYGSNRGHDSIVVYAFDAAAGKLTYIEHVSVEGKHPRHFALTPNGRYLIAANRDTNNLVTFHVDQQSGKLTFTGVNVEVSKPVCVQPVYLAAR
ncbi:lactonase family protein [Paenibacillus sp. GCM10027626]|uniref:lactonase family protein n=1 Tax=Paenibacillus sp. GCM10027626 TaxID=3273411 RepID=UPI00363E6A43